MTQFWNQRYSSPEYAYGRTPNTFFAEALTDLQPGRMLLPGEGEGRNAVFAARAGWDVDAVDFSEEGRKKALRLADENDVTINYSLGDLEELAPAKHSYDVVALIFVHLPPILRKSLHARCIEALRPGGRMIIEAFTPDQLKYTSGGPKEQSLLYTRSMLEADFLPLEIVFQEEKTIILNEGPFHDGEAAVVRLIAIKK